jgi:uncharacterized protein with von Willebrand factor type A (vWA) domain
VSAEHESRLAENILLFCRTLRQAGLPIGPGQIIDACAAVLQAGIERRDDFYYALRSVLATDPTQFRLFDQAFHIYFRNPRLLERMLGLLLPTLEMVSDNGNGDTAIRRLLEALSEVSGAASEDVAIEVDQSGSWSDREILRHKDFAQMSLAEQREAKDLLRHDLDIVDDAPTRRFRPDHFGHRYDLRRSIRMMLRNNGQLLELARKKRQLKQPTLVLICDISGSMSQYARMFLHFAHALSARRRLVHSFVFGTRLTNISHRLADRDVDRALDRVSTDVRDWDGGTRIAACLKHFNVAWGRRVLSSRAHVVLLSDGLERGTDSDLDFQMARLHASCDYLVWMNPLLRYKEFEAKANGIRTMLPHVDRFLPAHNVASLAQLRELLRRSGSGSLREAA